MFQTRLYKGNNIVEVKEQWTNDFLYYTVIIYIYIYICVVKEREICKVMMNNEIMIDMNLISLKMLSVYLKKILIENDFFIYSRWGVSNNRGDYQTFTLWCQLENVSGYQKYCECILLYTLKKFQRLNIFDEIVRMHNVSTSNYEVVFF